MGSCSDPFVKNGYIWPGHQVMRLSRRPQCYLIVMILFQTHDNVSSSSYCAVLGHRTLFSIIWSFRYCNLAALIISLSWYGAVQLLRLSWSPNHESLSWYCAVQMLRLDCQNSSRGHDTAQYKCFDFLDHRTSPCGHDIVSCKYSNCLDCRTSPLWSWYCAIAAVWIPQLSRSPDSIWWSWYCAVQKPWLFQLPKFTLWS